MTRLTDNDKRFGPLTWGPSSWTPWRVVFSYFGLLGQASHSHTDRARLANALRRRGKAVKADLTKIY